MIEGQLVGAEVARDTEHGSGAGWHAGRQQV